MENSSNSKVRLRDFVEILFAVPAYISGILKRGTCSHLFSYLTTKGIRPRLLRQLLFTFCHRVVFVVGGGEKFEFS